MAESKYNLTKTKLYNSFVYYVEEKKLISKNGYLVD